MLIIDISFTSFFSTFVVVVVTQPLPSHGCKPEDHGAPEAGQLTRVWTRGCRETKSRQRASGAKSLLLDSAQSDERCPGTGVHSRCMKDFQFF